MAQSGTEPYTHIYIYILIILYDGAAAVCAQAFSSQEVGEGQKAQGIPNPCVPEAAVGDQAVGEAAAVRAEAFGSQAVWAPAVSEELAPITDEGVRLLSVANGAEQWLEAVQQQEQLEPIWAEVCRRIRGERR